MGDKDSTKPGILGLDLETYSDVDLGKCGLYRYVEGDFHILILAYAFDDDEVTVVDMACGEPIPQEVLEAIDDPQVIKAAWNAQFERTCIGHYLGRRLSPEGWRCSMVHAASISLPLALKNAAKVLRTGEQKDRAGENLIKYFSVPCKPTKSNGGRTRNLPEHDPQGWQRFKDYCAQDVRTERDIQKRLEQFPMPDKEWDFYHMDQRINDRGVRIDTELVHQAIACDLMLSDEMSRRAYELTGLENPNSVSQLKSWLEGRGIEVASLGKKDVAAMITDLDKNSCDQEALDMLKLRLQMAKSSVKKYQAAERCVCADGRARGLFQFYGANRTGRYSSRLIQLQNLARNEISTLDEARELVKMGELQMLESIYGNVPDILSQLIRTMLVPKEGCEFIVADFSAIEARVLAWLAGEQWRLDAFRNGEDIYCASASQMFGVPVVKHGINGELRQKGKVAELACIAEGSLVLTDQGLVPIEDVATEHLLWDGVEWVNHDGVIYKGEREVIEYDGLTATPDHPVWIEGKKGPVHFGFAASIKAHLIQTGDGGKAIRLGKDHISRKTVERQDEHLCSVCCNQEIITGTFQGRDYPRCGNGGVREEKKLALHPGKVRVYDIRNAGRRHRFTVSGKLVHNCGYQGGTGALISMGALSMGLTEKELPDIIEQWRAASPHIVQFWWDMEKAATETVKTHEEHMAGRIRFQYYSGTLWMVLPSGRKLAYLKPKLQPNRFGRMSLTFEGVGNAAGSGGWSRQETYGGKLVENCVAEGTLVLTDRGLVSIENIREDDLIWDGVEWVSHEGLIDKGIQNTVSVGGIRLTPDHKILTEEGWRKCVEADRFNWADVSLPYGSGTDRKYKRRESTMGVPVHLREENCGGSVGFKEETIPNKVMRMHERKIDIQSEIHAWDDSSSGIWCVAFHEAKMHGSESSGLLQLRRTWYNGLPGVGRKLRKILGRYGTNLSERTGTGSYQQRRRLLSWKLPMGKQEDQLQEQEVQPAGRFSLWENNSVRAFRKNRYWCNNAPLQAGSQLADRITVHPTGLKEQVYDIRNCGPRHRFAVYDPEAGKLRIVSNCTQATARDILTEAMWRLEQAGFEIVGHVHDEVIIEAPTGQHTVEGVCSIMAQNPDWCPDCPLAAAGYLAPNYYFKD